MTDYAAVFLLPPIFTDKCLQNQGKLCQRRGVAIANHCATLNSLCVVNLLQRSISSTAGSFGQKSSKSLGASRFLSQGTVSTTLPGPGDCNKKPHDVCASWPGECLAP